MNEFVKDNSQIMSSGKNQHIHVMKIDDEFQSNRKNINFLDEEQANFNQGDENQVYARIEYMIQEAS